MKKIFKIITTITVFALFSSCANIENTELTATEKNNPEINTTEVTESKNDVSTFKPRSLKKNESNSIFGEWKIKKIIGFTSVNDNESEIQNYPDGPTIISSDIKISKTNIEYNINLDTKNPIPENYINQSKNNYDIVDIYVSSIITPQAFIENQGTMGGFEMNNEFLPSNNVAEIYVKNTEGNEIPLIKIFDDNRVVWYMYGCYFELEKIK